MHSFKSRSLREEHAEEVIITDEDDRQQTVTAKIEIRYEKLDFKIKTSFNSATALATDFKDAIAALIQRATQIGKAKLAEYQQREGIGTQGDLFGQGNGEPAGSGSN